MVWLVRKMMFELHFKLLSLVYIYRSHVVREGLWMVVLFLLRPTNISLLPNSACSVLFYIGSSGEWQKIWHEEFGGSWSPFYLWSWISAYWFQFSSVSAKWQLDWKSSTLQRYCLTICWLGHRNIPSICQNKFLHV